MDTGSSLKHKIPPSPQPSPLTSPTYKKARSSTPVSSTSPVSIYKTVRVSRHAFSRHSPPSTVLPAPAPAQAISSSLLFDCPPSPSSCDGFDPLSFDYQSLPSPPNPVFSYYDPAFGRKVREEYDRSQFIHFLREGKYGTEIAQRYKRGFTPEELRQEYEDRIEQLRREDEETVTSDDELPPDQRPAVIARLANRGKERGKRKACAGSATSAMDVVGGIEKPAAMTSNDKPSAVITARRKKRVIRRSRHTMHKRSTPKRTSAVSAL